MAAQPCFLRQAFEVTPKASSRGANEVSEPGISRFPDAQLRIRGLVLTHHPGMTKDFVLRQNQRSPTRMVSPGRERPKAGFPSMRGNQTETPAPIGHETPVPPSPQ